jgi:protein TonB
MTDNTILADQATEYGAFELKRLYSKHFSLGMAIAVVLHLFLIGTYIFIQAITRDDENNIATVRILKYSELGPPPSLDNTAAQALAVTAPVAPTVGIPTPVPDAEAPKEQTIATQQEMNKVASPVGEGNGSGGVQITQDLKVEAPKEDEAPDMNAFTPVEKQPEVVVHPVPVYPDLAKRAGVEGTVFVKILVNKEGKPIKAVVVKSDSEVFNQPSIEAALKFVFTPAIQHKSPVMVWVVIPFKFKLNQ